MRLFALAFLCLMIFGCKKETASEVTPEFVRRGLDRICKVYESELSGKSPCDMDGVSQINRLKSPKERLACTRYFVDRLLSLKIDHLSYWRQSDVIDFTKHTIMDVWRNLPNDDAGWEKRYDLELRLLEWRKRHVERVKGKKPATPAPGDLDAEWEMSGWQLIYDGGITEYEWSLRNLETMFPYLTRQMSEAARNRIKMKIEAYLGRPMRTLEQLRADHKTKRHVVFVDVQ